MSQVYTNPKREADTYSLPDAEVWQDRVSVTHCPCGDYELPYESAHVEAVAYCPSCEQEAESVEDTNKLGWWYWYCFPGCMPESTPSGPYESESAAVLALRDEAGEDEDEDA